MAAPSLTFDPVTVMNSLPSSKETPPSRRNRSVVSVYNRTRTTTSGSLTNGIFLFPPTRDSSAVTMDALPLGPAPYAPRGGPSRDVASSVEGVEAVLERPDNLDLVHRNAGEILSVGYTLVHADHARGETVIPTRPGIDAANDAFRGTDLAQFARHTAQYWATRSSGLNMWNVWSAIVQYVSRHANAAGPQHGVGMQQVANARYLTDSLHSENMDEAMGEHYVVTAHLATLWALISGGMCPAEEVHRVVCAPTSKLLAHASVKAMMEKLSGDPSQMSRSQWNTLIQVVISIVVQRGQLLEILTLVDILANFPPTLEECAVPECVLSLVSNLRFGGVQVHAEEVDYTPLILPIGITICRCCVSKKHDIIVIAATEGLFFIDKAMTRRKRSKIQIIPFDEPTQYWAMHLSPNEDLAVVSVANGMEHIVVDVKLVKVVRRFSVERPMLFLFGQDGDVAPRRPPFLPTGQRGSLRVASNADAESIRMTFPSAFPPNATLHIAAMVSSTIEGKLMILEGDDGAVGLTFSSRSVVLTHGTSTFTAARPTDRPAGGWMCVVASLHGGAWTIVVDGGALVTTAKHKGAPRTSTLQAPSIISAQLLMCRGNVRGLASWSGDVSRSVVASLLSGGRLAGGTKILQLPMDEGGGLWLKDGAAKDGRTIPLPPHCSWDTSDSPPVVGTREGDELRVCIPDEALRQSEVLATDHQLTLFFRRGDECYVALIDQKTNFIESFRQLPHQDVHYAMQSRSLHMFVNRDESHMFVLDSAANALRVFQYESEAAMRARTEEAPTSATIGGVLQKMFSALNVGASSLLASPPVTHAITPKTLALSHALLLRCIRRHSTDRGAVELAAMLRVVEVHVRSLLRAGNLPVDVIAEVLQTCKTLTTAPNDKVVCDGAARLVELCTQRCSTTSERLTMLLGTIREDNIDHVRHMLKCREIMSFVVELRQHGILDTLVDVWRHLCESTMPASGVSEGVRAALADRLVWLALCIPHFPDVVGRCLDAILTIVEAADVREGMEAFRVTAMHTALLPLLLATIQHASEVLDKGIVARLLSLLKKFREAPSGTSVTVKQVTFVSRSVVRVTPGSGQGWAIRVDVDPAAERVSLSHHGASLSGDDNVFVTILQEGSSKGRILTSMSPITIDRQETDVQGILMHGKRSVAVTVSQRIEQEMDVSFARLITDGIWEIVLRVTQSMTRRPRPMPVYTAPLRGGLSMQVLKRHGVTIPAEYEFLSVQSPSVASTPEKIVADAMGRMRGYISESCVQTYSSIFLLLLHSGYSPSMAEEELRTKWMMELSSKFQGEEKSELRLRTISICEWIMRSTFRHAYTGGRRGSAYATDDAVSSSRRSSRTVGKSSCGTELLDNLAAIVQSDLDIETIEAALVERYRVAIDTTCGLQQVEQLLQADDVTPSQLRSCLKVIKQFVGDSQGHYIDPYVGCGTRLEHLVRESFVKLLIRATECIRRLTLKVEAPSDIACLLSKQIPNADLVLTLYAIMGHPWDDEDQSLFMSPRNGECFIKPFLDDLVDMASIPCSVANSLDECYDDDDDGDVARLQAIADVTSVALRYHNGITTNEVGVSVAQSTDGTFTVTVDASTPMIITADDPWLCGTHRGLPGVYYFEVSITVCSNIRVGLVPYGLDGAAMDSTFACTYSTSGHYMAFGVPCASPLPPFSGGDVVGCGFCPSTRAVFFTLNGISLGTIVAQRHVRCFVPVVHFDDAGAVTQCVVNFGTAPFGYDYRLEHPAMALFGATHFMLADHAAILLSYLTSQWCDLTMTSFQPILMMCIAGCAAVATHTATAMAAAHVDRSDDDDSFDVLQTVLEVPLRQMLSTLQLAFSLMATDATLNPDVVALLRILLLEVHLPSIQLRTMRLLSAMLPMIDAGTFQGVNLANLVYKIAASVPVVPRTSIDYSPTWVATDLMVSLMSARAARTLPQAQHTSLYGPILPRHGTVSFTICIERAGMPLGQSLKGGYYVGVCLAHMSTTRLSTSEWKYSKSHKVWALHDTTPQLPHATNPTVRTNNFHRVYGSGEVVTVVVNRTTGGVSFQRDGVFLAELFNDIPQDEDIRPMAHLFNDDVVATIGGGTMLPTVRLQDIISASAVDVLRAMAVHPLLDQHVVAEATAEVNAYTDGPAWQEHGSPANLSPERSPMLSPDVSPLTSPRRRAVEDLTPRVALALFGAVPNPSTLEYVHPRGSCKVEVIDVQGSYIRGIIAGNYYTVGMQYVYRPRNPVVRGVPQVVNVDDLSKEGFVPFVSSLVRLINDRINPRISTSCLVHQEGVVRGEIAVMESDAFDSLQDDQRLLLLSILCREPQQAPRLSLPPPPICRAHDYVFASHLSHTSVVVSQQCCGRLVSLVGGSVAASYLAMAMPLVDPRGKSTIRFRIVRGPYGQLLGGGYYVGVCARSFTWRRKDVITASTEAWAVHDTDDSTWRQRHMQDRRIPPSQEHNVYVSGDIVSITVDRTERTLTAHRINGLTGEEVSLGILFDNIPPEVELHPFVQMYNSDASASLLPLDGTEPIRLTVQKPHAYSVGTQPSRVCDGCHSQHRTTALSMEDGWYRCNYCDNFSLCRSCFHMYMHPLHTFTLVDQKLFVAPAHLVATPPVGSRVAVPTSSTRYLRSQGCAREDTSLTVMSRNDASFVVWGLMDTYISLDVLPTDDAAEGRPIFVGVGLASEICRRDYHALRSDCVNGTEYLAPFCMAQEGVPRDTRPREDGTSAAARNISLIVGDGVVSCIIDWIRTQQRPLPPMVVEKSDQPLAVVVLFTRSDIQVAVAQRHRPYSLATVVRHTVPPSSLFVVEDVETHAQRTVCRSEVSVALQGVAHMSQSHPPRSLFVSLSHGFASVASISKVSGGRYVAHVMGMSAPIHVPSSQLFGTVLATTIGAPISSRNLTASGGNLNIVQGAVLSRIVAILILLLEDDYFAHSVLGNLETITPTLSHLASATMSSDFRNSFLIELRSTYALTHKALDMNFDAKVEPLPTFEVAQKKTLREWVAVGVLVYVMNGTQVDPCVYAVEKILDDQIVIRPIEGGETRCVSEKKCIPVKQAFHVPWSTHPQGLPATLVEYRSRMLDLSWVCGAEGDWSAEMLSQQEGSHATVLFQLHATKSDGTLSGTAHVTRQGHRDEGQVSGSFNAATRRIKLKISVDASAQDATRLRELIRRSGANVPRRASLSELRRIAADLSPSGAVETWDCEGVLDDKGFNVTGMWMHSSDSRGALYMFLLQSLPPLPTGDVPRWRLVEPLPDVRDPPDTPTSKRSLSENLFRLIVMLSRHLLLCARYQAVILKTQTGDSYDPDEFIRYHAHPLTPKLVMEMVNKDSRGWMYCQMVRSAVDRIHESRIPPWDLHTLASIVVSAEMGESSAAKVLFWDALHAVVTSSHHCGPTFRRKILQRVSSMVQRSIERCGSDKEKLHSTMTRVVELLSVLCVWVDQKGKERPVSSDVPATIELLLQIPSTVPLPIQTVPLNAMRCFVDIAEALQNASPLPAVVDGESIWTLPPRSIPLRRIFGTMEAGDGFADLKVGKAMVHVVVPPKGKYYYEVRLPEGSMGPYVIGWGTKDHCDVPTQHVGTDTVSFGFSGQQYGTRTIRAEYRTQVQPTNGVCVGALIDMDNLMVAWSVGGVEGSFVEIPISLSTGLYAFVSTGSCSGLQISVSADTFLYCPEGYSDIYGRRPRPRVDGYDPTRRSSIAVGVSECSRLARCIASPSDLRATFSDPTHHPALRAVLAAEACLQSVCHLLDLEATTFEGVLARAFFTARDVATPLFRRTFATPPPLSEQTAPAVVTVRAGASFSDVGRPPEASLAMSVLGQLHGALGAVGSEGWRRSPLFSVNLVMSPSNHAPQDVGGPYRQVWTLLAEELMAHPDRCFPHTNYHRNPILRPVTTQHGAMVMVPNRDGVLHATSETEMLTFLGKLMGYAALSGTTPLGVDLSPFVWKFITERPLNAEDYYHDVDEGMRRTLADDTVVGADIDDDIVPGFQVRLAELDSAGGGDMYAIPVRRKIAEEALVHSMDRQLTAIRKGVWEILGKAYTRSTRWSDLERMVCGTEALTEADILMNVVLQLSSPSDAYFVRMVKDMRPQDRANLLCFGCGQRRLPLLRKVRVVDGHEDAHHLPRAQSCASLIYIPRYPSYAVFAEKFSIALRHVFEIELA